MEGVGYGFAMDLGGPLEPVSRVLYGAAEHIELCGAKRSAGLEESLIDRARTPEHLVDDPGWCRRLGEFLDAACVGGRQRLGQCVARGGELSKRSRVELVDGVLDGAAGLTARSCGAFLQGCET